MIVSKMIRLILKCGFFSGDIPSFSGGAWRFQWQGQGCLEDTPCKTSIGKSQEKKKQKGKNPTFAKSSWRVFKDMSFVCLFWYTYPEIVMYNYIYYMP